MKVKTSTKKEEAARILASIERVCVDLAKSTFHVVGLDADRKTIFRRKFTRGTPFWDGSRQPTGSSSWSWKPVPAPNGGASSAWLWDTRRC